MQEGAAVGALLIKAPEHARCLLRIEPIPDREGEAIGIDRLACSCEVIDRCRADIDVFGNEFCERGLEISQLLMAERSKIASINGEEDPAPGLGEREGRAVDRRYRKRWEGVARIERPGP